MTDKDKGNEASEKQMPLDDEGSPGSHKRQRTGINPAERASSCSASALPVDYNITTQARRHSSDSETSSDSYSVDARPEEQLLDDTRIRSAIDGGPLPRMGLLPKLTEISVIEVEDSPLYKRSLLDQEAQLQDAILRSFPGSDVIHSDLVRFIELYESVDEAMQVINTTVNIGLPAMYQYARDTLFAARTEPVATPPLIAGSMQNPSLAYVGAQTNAATHGRCQSEEAPTLNVSRFKQMLAQKKMLEQPKEPGEASPQERLEHIVGEDYDMFRNDEYAAQRRETEKKCDEERIEKLREERRQAQKTYKEMKLAYAQMDDQWIEIEAARLRKMAREYKAPTAEEEAAEEAGIFDLVERD